MANLLNDRLNESDDIKEKRSKKKKVKSNKSTVKSEPQKIAPKKEPDKREEDLDEKIEALTGEDIVKEQKKLKRSKHKYYFVKIFMCFMCGYLLFLIYGVMVTNYDYDDSGNVTAQIMSREDIKRQKEYSSLLGYYMDARDLYQKILVLNYRLDSSMEDPLDLVPEYEELLNDSNKILVQLKAFTPSKSYSQAYNLLGNWVNSDLSSYLQEISAAISQNSTDHLQNAINNKQRMYNDCYQLTANFISLGENVKGVDISSLKEWSPEEYIKREMGEV